MKSLLGTSTTADYHSFRGWSKKEKYYLSLYASKTSTSFYVPFRWENMRYKTLNLLCNIHCKQMCCRISCEVDEKWARKPRFVAQSRTALDFSQQLSSTRNKYFCCTTSWSRRWKMWNIHPKLAAKQCCGHPSWEFLYLVSIFPTFSFLVICATLGFLCHHFYSLHKTGSRLHTAISTIVCLEENCQKIHLSGNFSPTVYNQNNCTVANVLHVLYFFNSPHITSVFYQHFQVCFFSNSLWCQGWTIGHRGGLGARSTFSLPMVERCHKG